MIPRTQRLGDAILVELIFGVESTDSLERLLGRHLHRRLVDHLRGGAIIRRLAVIAETLVHDLGHLVQYLGVEVVAVPQFLEKGIGDEGREFPDRFPRQQRPAGERRLPLLDLDRTLDQTVEGFLANLGAGIGEKLGDGGNIIGGDDGVGDPGGDLLTARDRGQPAVDRQALDDFQQILVGQQRRELKNGLGHGRLGVHGEALDHPRWRGGNVLQCLGQYLAHLRQLVAGENLQHLVGDLLKAVVLVLAQLRRQPGDLESQIRANPVVAVMGQQKIGPSRCVGVDGDSAADLGRFVLRQVVENLAADIFAIRQGPAHLGARVAGKLLRFLVAERRVGAETGPAEQAEHQGLHGAAALLSAAATGGGAISNRPLPPCFAMYMA